jgi:hypothetical protein
MRGSRLPGIDSIRKVTVPGAGADERAQAVRKKDKARRMGAVRLRENKIEAAPGPRGFFFAAFRRMKTADRDALAVSVL